MNLLLRLSLNLAILLSLMAITVGFVFLIVAYPLVAASLVWACVLLLILTVEH